MSSNEDDPVHIEWIEKFLRNEATEQERVHVLNWMTKAKITSDDLRQLISLPDGIKFLLAIDDDVEWSRLKAKISQQKTMHLSFSWYKVAAAIAFLVGISAIFFLIRFTGTQDHRIAVTANVDNLRIALPDSSKVYLRKGATITYTEAFAENDRQIALSGEGFFDITRDTFHPFIISTLNCRVRVLGTSFSVQTDSMATDVIVSTGKVGIDQNGFEPIYLYPGDKGVVTKGFAPSKESNKNLNFISWKTGRLVFENTSLKNVIDELEDHFQTTIVVTNPVNEWPTYTSRFDHATLEEVLTEMEQVLPLTYTQDSNSVSIMVKN